MINVAYQRRTGQICRRAVKTGFAKRGVGAAPLARTYRLPEIVRSTASSAGRPAMADPARLAQRRAQTKEFAVRRDAACAEDHRSRNRKPYIPAREAGALS